MPEAVRFERWAIIFEDGSRYVAMEDEDTTRASLRQRLKNLNSKGRLARVTITEGDGWRPIATCPKDRDTRFIVFNDGHMWITNWHVCYGSVSPLFDFVPVYEGLFGGGIATHWQPLPEPPHGMGKEPE